METIFITERKVKCLLLERNWNILRTFLGHYLNITGTFPERSCNFAWDQLKAQSFQCDRSWKTWKPVGGLVSEQEVTRIYWTLMFTGLLMLASAC